MGKRLQIVVTCMLGLIAVSVVANYWLVQWKRSEALEIVQKADDDCAANPEMGCEYYYAESIKTHCWIFRETADTSAEAFCMSDKQYDVFKDRKVRRHIQISRDE